jgi:alpha-L-fucosidase
MLTAIKHIALLLAFAGYSMATFAQGSPETVQQKETRLQWWKDARFGMFIHWGIYAVPAGIYQGKEVNGTGEWILHQAKIPLKEYEQYAAQFNPQQFDALQWVQIAKQAGMKYIVITAKHHDGFGLWDSRLSDYDIMDASPFRRDILRELTDACRQEGIRLGFYYSIMDWHHPDAKAKDYPHQRTENPNWERYRETYMKPQLRELIENYQPAILWFDGEWIDEWTEQQGKDLYNFVRSLSPDILINNRVGKGRKGMQGMNKDDDTYAGDFGTPEQEILDSYSDFPWESCMTMNDTWGFKANDHHWKSSETLIHQLIDAAAKGGNYLLNVGPTAEGLIPAPSIDRLREMGNWLTQNGEAIYGTDALRNYAEGNLRFTKARQSPTVYAINLQPSAKALTISSISLQKGATVHLLGSKSPLKWKTANKTLTIKIPAGSQQTGKYPQVFKITNASR